MKAFNHGIAENPININQKEWTVLDPSKHQNKSKNTPLQITHCVKGAFKIYFLDKKIVCNCVTYFICKVVLVLKHPQPQNSS